MNSLHATGLVAGLALMAATARVAAQDGPAGPDHRHNDAATGVSGVEHSSHRAAIGTTRYEVSIHRYDIPDLRLIDTSGSSASLRELLESDEPIALNFIFTTCTTICPVMTATFSQMQRRLGAALT